MARAVKRHQCETWEQLQEVIAADPEAIDRVRREITRIETVTPARCASGARGVRTTDPTALGSATGGSDGRFGHGPSGEAPW